MLWLTAPSFPDDVVCAFKTHFSTMFQLWWVVSFGSGHTDSPFLYIKTKKGRSNQWHPTVDLRVRGSLRIRRKALRKTWGRKIKLKLFFSPQPVEPLSPLTHQFWPKKPPLFHQQSMIGWCNKSTNGKWAGTFQSSRVWIQFFLWLKKKKKRSPDLPKNEIKYYQSITVWLQIFNCVFLLTF